MNSDSNSKIYDVLIVGAGPSGAVAAKRFAEEGYSVICLEQGEYPDYTSIRSSEPEFELTKEKVFNWSPNVRRATSDYPIDDSESDIAPLMWNGVGGSSILYGAAWHRLKPSDFRVKTLDGVADDWPLTYEDLAPFYDRVDVDFSVSGIAGDPASPHFEVPLPPFPLTDLDRKFSNAHERLGWHWWPGSNAIATVKHGALEPCVRRGACMWGCFDGAKASVDRTHWPKNIKMGVKLVQKARVLRVETDGAGLATGATYVNRDTGQTHFQAARIVIVSANGIGTPRLLLNSASTSHPNGLGNSSGMVGKRLMMHPFSSVVGLFEEFFENWQGPWGQRAYSLEFAETRPGLGFVRGAKWQLMGTGGPLNAINSYPWGDTAVWGQDFHKTIKQRFGRSAYWAILAEDLPSDENRVMLDPDARDVDGLPLAKVIYHTSENSRRLLAYNEEMAIQSMKEAGAYETIVAPQLRETGWHILGTSCMGNDRDRSVVDGYGRSHDVSNLYVMDGSVMPTSGSVNPTGTVAALALRNTEAIIRNAANQKVSTSHV
ncbi:GMC family oxidoreductase [Burkholderia sp. SCN-KJ]|uniref:GMC family oxidoreductase n=1 Tax=Burkholderia sp. SCN-KJ TaxID=2969248 RepID=UPI0021504D39|nr:GMC family oxidoreductase [Burkholderia sp. SCN-KJ]MCR4471588.1 GMC family oxidoreductase [Burkholderia sp. SCN-KJ]